MPGGEEMGLKPLPTIPMIPTIPHSRSESPRIQNTPVSPVRVNFQPDHWASHHDTSNNYGSPAQHSQHQPYMAQSAVIENLQDRDLPRTPDAPTPPPHSPAYEEQLRRQGMMSQEPRQLVGAGPKPLPPLSHPATQPHAGELLSPINIAPNGQRMMDSNFSPEFVTSPETDSIGAASSTNGLRAHDPNRHSRESDTTSSTTQQKTSTESSATTSASSVSGINETSDCQEMSANSSPDSSIVEGNMPRNQSVPLFQYHHQNEYPIRVASVPHEVDHRAASNPDLIDTAASINRHLTPSHYMRRSSLPRPQSAYSAYSDVGPRGRSPAFMPGGTQFRAPSVQSRRSPETRPSSYAELLNVPYPQPAPAPISFDNSQLRNAVGNNASLLSTTKTLEMYRQNLKKTGDMSIQYSFAVCLISTAQEHGLNFDEQPAKKLGRGARESPSPFGDDSSLNPQELVKEARQILQKLSSAGYPFAQYYLADGYASGLFNKGKEDYNSAFPLFVLAAKHGHAESAYRTALCYEFGWGCRKDPAKAVQFLRTAASKRHPGAMTRLGKACLSGDLGEKRYREGIKWMKLAAESADAMYNAAPYQLGCLYETGYGDDIFQDETYAAELFTQAAELGHPEANYRMGDAYEHGKLGCPRDPALSVHFYTGAAERGHAGAMMGLCAWYMVGAEPILEKDEEEAYEWARRSAELGTYFCTFFFF
jgi:TPR repeat protein